MILDEHGLDDLARHASADVEIDGQAAQELPFACIDPSVSQQEIGEYRATPAV